MLKSEVNMKVAKNSILLKNVVRYGCGFIARIGRTIHRALLIEKIWFFRDGEYFVETMKLPLVAAYLFQSRTISDIELCLRGQHELSSPISKIFENIFENKNVYDLPHGGRSSRDEISERGRDVSEITFYDPVQALSRGYSYDKTFKSR